MKGYRVMILFLMLAATLSSACGLFTLGVTATATPESGQTATALVQTIQALSTQNAFLLPTNTPPPTVTPLPTATSTPTLIPTPTQTPTNTPTSIPTSPPTIARAFVNGYGYSYPYGYPNYGYPNYGYPGNRYPSNRYPPYRQPPYRQPLVYPGNNQICNRAAFVSDVSIPDGMVLGAGDSFVKTWRLSNAGSCIWNSNYNLVFSSGSQLSAPSSVNLPGSVAPGQTVDISVSMVSPNNTGTYTGYWKLENDTGTVFGIGGYGNSPFFVEIVVE
jgi:hypothetical protein